MIIIKPLAAKLTIKPEYLKLNIYEEGILLDISAFAFYNAVQKYLNIQWFYRELRC
jgi:hypothetical protein